MVRAKKIRRNSKIKEFKDINTLLKNIYGQGFDELSVFEIEAMQTMAHRDKVIYYCSNPYKAEIDQEQSIIFSDNEEELNSRSDLLSEEI